MNVYDFTVTDNSGKQVSLEIYKGSVLLIVNTASKCGFTPQYEGLQKLHEKYKDEKFEVLGFPCNQFANQEPGSDEEIKNFCTINYGVTFPLFKKINVNGKDTAPLYAYLKESAPGAAGKAIKWNFTKFLIDSNGNVTERFASKIEPKDIEGKIEELL